MLIWCFALSRCIYKNVKDSGLLQFLTYHHVVQYELRSSSIGRIGSEKVYRNHPCIAFAPKISFVDQSYDEPRECFFITKVAFGHFSIIKSASFSVDLNERVLR